MEGTLKTVIGGGREEIPDPWLQSSEDYVRRKEDLANRQYACNALYTQVDVPERSESTYIPSPQ